MCVGIRTGVAAKRFGGQTNDTMAIENYTSVLETDGHQITRGTGDYIFTCPATGAQERTRRQQSPVVVPHILARNSSSSDRAGCDSAP